MNFPVIEPFDAALTASLRARVDGLAKPPGALGRLEDLAVRLGAIQNRIDPRIRRVRACVVAGDHGLNAQGVSAYPSAVTQAMVATMLAGRASVNALARACDVEVCIVDAGVDADLAPHPRLRNEKIRRGTRDATIEAALTDDEVARALAAGIKLAGEESDIDALMLGEMGIGNSATAALLLHRLAPAALNDCIGAGAGHDAAGMARKIAALERAAARSNVTAPLDVLREFGGLEIILLAGIVLGGAASRRVILVDGFIASVAALAAIRLVPAAREYCIFAHASAERGHRILLDVLQTQPLLDLGLRLGEGTGAVLAAPLLRAAVNLFSDVATLDDVLSGRLG
ncbi:nicotinate-nucleotide--dimethylbenzimidazole phosphoribosyltransferase [Roseiterribacter gracilis]|uniref:Nicotinate-nucleotide--dimethylbenzimidazole phosphoribosyltransferase n=1 Tax=Roseiterribacter gracilis TaxID=2812848 RepID=A0A8S8XA24_9PROT|nr:nicotinate-nucleotide--dimethylbenzimidazole phosphoribosyltransferase [Rhodospirillales bacterium TMPK1]